MARAGHILVGSSPKRTPGFTCYVVFIGLILCLLLGSVAGALEDGGAITEDEVVEDWQSPLTIQTDVIITERATVTIKPGVELRFNPGVMMAVNGTLLAVGTASKRIVFTRAPSAGAEKPSWAEDARLVDERSVLEGRLQLLYRGKWRGVCANFVNWTSTDANVTCRQLNFDHGTFYFQSWARNDSVYMLYHRPSCLGGERSALDCPRANSIKLGSRICANQQTVHLKCYGVAPGKAEDYWWGLEFYNSTVRTDIEGRKKINESASRLTFVDILYAGVSPAGEPMPAVRAQPLAPHLVNANIKFSALDATNFTNVKSSTIVHNSELSFNRGHGLVVETNLGRVSVTNSNIHNNAGNGIKAKFLDGRWPYFNKDRTFCTLPNVGVSQFPLIMVGIPVEINNYCDRVFRTEEGQKLTLVVLEMDIVDDAEGQLEVWDGRYDWNTKIGTYPIINGTLPQGVTTTLHYMRVRFTWKRPPNWPEVNCPLLRECVKITIMIDSGPATVPEIYLNNTDVANNTQHGAYLENVRNYAFISHSRLNYNEYGAGLRVYGGAGDIHVNYSSVDFNQDNGVNITYDGGYRIFNLSSFSNNFGNGINVTFNETKVDNKSRVAKHQRTEVFRSVVVDNDGWGVRVGNSCRAGSAVINDTRFAYNRRDAIELESCYKVIPNANMTNFTVGYNTFEGNYGHGVKIKPMVNVFGRIGNNTFMGHPRHALLIDNGEDFLENRYYSNLKVDYEVTSNIFEDNSGYYVAHLRLSQGSNKQKMVFKYNRFQNNFIQGSFPSLNERSRAYAVVIISSSNINFARNYLVNPDSRYELATHLMDRITIQATPQWWGTLDYNLIIERIFDRFNRYNLAEIKYHPVLRTDDLYWPEVTDEERPKEVDFNRGDKLGGRLAYHFTTDPSISYTVDRDITILPEGRLTVAPGTTLSFENSLGMLVEGVLDASARATASTPVTFHMANMTEVVNHTRVRLVDGPDDFSGRLEVRPAGEEEWGTVCSQGWTITDASVVCQMLGFVVHPDDWWPQTASAGDSVQPIWRSEVTCTDLDMDITMCEADGLHDHTCNHTMDVSVTCTPATWAGIHFRATARSSVMRHVNITAAGLMDPTAISYVPAIKIDYNVHTLDNLEVSNCMASGIEILHNDAYANAKLANSRIINNLGDGVSTRGPFFEVHYSTIADNKGTGFVYNPQYTALQAQQMRQGIHNPKVLTPDLGTLYIPREGYLFLVTQQDTSATLQTYDTEIHVDFQYRVVVDVLDYNPDPSEEKVEIFDGGKKHIKPTTSNWQIEEDLVDFPIVSTSTNLTLRVHVRGPVSGRLTFALRSKPESWHWPWPDVKLKNTTVMNNKVGIETRHYNQPSNEYLDLFFRYRWQTVQLYGVEARANREEALRVPSITKYHELYMPSFDELAQMPFRVAEITYNIDSCLIIDNGEGVIGEHNHVEFSNNIWIWEVTNNRIEGNKAGGFNILLPKVNLMYQELYNHSVDVNDTVFENNQMFEFRVDGFYCNSSISRNRFANNNCRMGCITLSGTEKDLDIYDNEIVENTGVYMMEFNMDSHTPYTRWVDAHMMNNNFKRNKGPETSRSSHSSSSPTSYTLGIKGVQNVTVNRNLFANNLDYELVGGQASSLLENYLDVTENWWGTSDQVGIQDKIFDFDDWNSYAIAEYFPHLTYDAWDAPVFTGEKLVQGMDLEKALGGRIQGDMTLKKRAKPYIVKRDLTVMPQGTLFIHSGVELQFFPNVGILVLGSLVANGKEDDRIKMGPVPGKDMGRRRRAAPPAKHGDVRLAPLLRGSSPDEGFVEIYNSTERRWTIICDSNFNDKTGEVACRSMGKEGSNVIVRRSRYYDHFVLGYPLMHEQRLEWFWRRTLICDGREPDIKRCRYKVNYNLLRCMEHREYVFLRCGERKLAGEFEYWGNLRFSTPEFEQGTIRPGFSSLNYLDIYGAGILHEERAAAIESVYRVPSTERVRITNCAWNGYDFIAPKDEFTVSYNQIENNNGYGIGGIVLNGESRYDVVKSSFVPLLRSQIPYNVFGLVRMCTSEKVILVKDRILIYHKYNFDTVDCIKILRSREPGKRVALRFLQLNVYNDTFYKNSVEMYNGEFFDPESKIGEVTANSTEDERASKYETKEYIEHLGLRVTASPAHDEYGFIAEVVTIPLSPDWRPDLGAGLRQQIFQTTMSGNQRGGFQFSNVGVRNPAVQIEKCNIQNCGYKLLNLTSPPVINLYVQNSKLVTVSNNYIAQNGGGITVETNGVATNLYGNITNNVIVHNTHGPNVHIEGQTNHGFDVRNNFIANNDVEYHNNLAMFGIRLNFTNNVVQKNYGQTTLNATVDKQVSISQRYISNAFYDNKAIGANKTTIFVGSAKHSFQDNYLFNWWNIFELVTYNRTKRELLSGNAWSYPDQDEPEVDAIRNWWGGKEPAFVRGRIWDRWDDDNLIRVKYDPFYKTNTSVMQGRCDPGWRLHQSRCYIYMGGVLPYHQAYRQCRLAAGRLAWKRDQGSERFLGEMVASHQENYDPQWVAWVYDEENRQDVCTAVINYKVTLVTCDQLHPFVCEKDPYVEPKMNWWPIGIGLGVVALLLIVLLILCGLVILKSRQRKEQRLDRRNSLRRSLRASKQSIYANQHAIQRVDTTGSLVSGTPERASVGSTKRRRPPLSARVDPGGVVNLSGVTLNDTSTDSIDKEKMYSARPSTPGSIYDLDRGFDYSSSNSKPNLSSSSYLDSDLQGGGAYYPNRLENEIAHIPARPQFDTVMRNEGFDDERSLDRSRFNSSSSAATAGARRYPPYNRGMMQSASSEHSLDGRPRPKPKETAM